MQDFYQILGLNRSATADEIKKAYRKMAIKHHPDKSTDVNANAVFQQINEAYQVLSHPERRQLYDYLLVHQLEAYLFDVPQPTPVYRSRPYAAHRVRRDPVELYRPYLKYARIASKFALAFCLTMWLDFVLPRTVSIETITAVPLESELRLYGGYASSGTKLLVTEHHTLPISREFDQSFSGGDRVKIYKTPLLATFLRVENLTNRHVTAPANYNLYNVFAFIPIILTITALLGTFYPKNTDFALKVGIANFTFSLLAIYFIILIN